MSSINTLRERISSYEDASDIKLLKRLPIVIVINGRSFKKITAPLSKPFDLVFLELMCGAAIKLSQEVDGSVMAYTFNDEIVLVARNDQTINTNAWYDNRAQKIASACASIATFEFNRLAKIKGVELFGDPVFTANTFVVPSITEAINVLVAKQQQAFHTALSMAFFYEMIKRHDPDTVRQTLMEKTPAEKAEILFETTGKDFNNLPLPFRRGVAVYRIPRVVSSGSGGEIRNKLTVNMELPIFTKDHEFLGSILR